MDKASVSGAEDCGFESHSGWLTYTFLTRSYEMIERWVLISRSFLGPSVGVNANQSQQCTRKEGAFALSSGKH